MISLNDDPLTLPEDMRGKLAAVRGKWTDPCLPVKGGPRG